MIPEMTEGEWTVCCAYNESIKVDYTKIGYKCFCSRQKKKQVQIKKACIYKVEC